MSTEDNKLLVRRQFDEIWNGGNWATADELYAPEYVNHDPYNPDQGTGPEGFKQRVGGYRSVLHDFDLRIERQIAEGDWVETHWSLRGIHGGALEGTPPPASRSTWTDSCSAISSTASSLKNGSTGTPWACSGRSALSPRPHRDRTLASRSSAASFRATATGHPGQYLTAPARPGGLRSPANAATRAGNRPSPRRLRLRRPDSIGKRLIRLHIYASQFVAETRAHAA